MVDDNRTDDATEQQETFLDQPRRNVLKMAGVGVGLTGLGAVATLGDDDGDGGGDTVATDTDNGTETETDGPSDHFLADLVDPTFGYPLAADETDDVTLQYVVNATLEEGPGAHENFPLNEFGAAAGETPTPVGSPMGTATTATTAANGTTAGNETTTGGADTATATETATDTATGTETATETGTETTTAGNGTTTATGTETTAAGTETTATTGTPGPGEEIPVEFFFDPVGLHVEPDALVHFYDEAALHTVTAFHQKFSEPMNTIPNRVPDGVPGFTSPPMTQGESWVYQFTEPGVYDYFCFPHLGLGMVARIVVFDPDRHDLQSPRFAAPDTGHLYPNDRRVLTAPELDPANIVEQGAVPWSALSLGGDGTRTGTETETDTETETETETETGTETETTTETDTATNTPTETETGTGTETGTSTDTCACPDDGTETTTGSDLG